LIPWEHRIFLSPNRMKILLPILSIGSIFFLFKRYDSHHEAFYMGFIVLWYIVSEIGILIAVRHIEVLLFRPYVLLISVVLTILEDLNRRLLFNI